METTYNNVCFICLKKILNDPVTLKDYDADNITYMQKIEYIFMKESIYLENMSLCPSCSSSLRICYDFKNKIAHSQEVWMKFFKGQIKVDEDEVADLPKIETIDDNADNNFDSTFDRYDINCDEILSQECTKDDNLNKSSSSLDPYYYCPECGEDFDFKEELSDHTCSNPNEPISKKQTYLCNQCYAKFDKRWKLKKHKNRVHKNNKNFDCSICNKTFKQAHHLREHITTHTGEKNYSCPVCEKKFQRGSSIKRHLKTHENNPGEKTKKTPFLCTICGKKFPFSNGVQRHMRVHMGEKNHECTVCRRRFTQSTHLQVHMRTHTGEKPYICEACGETFSLKVTLQKHMTVHSEDKIEDISFEDLKVIDLNYL